MGLSLCELKSNILVSGSNGDKTLRFWDYVKLKPNKTIQD